MGARAGVEGMERKSEAMEGEASGIKVYGEGEDALGDYDGMGGWM